MTTEPIINAKFKKFRESYELLNVSDGEAFEKFVNSAVLKTHQPDAFTADSELLDIIGVGGADDTGIDGLAIKVNGILVKNKDEVDDLIKRVKRATIEFIFIQSKYKANFSASELNVFISGVRNFLSNEQLLPINTKLKYLLKLKEYLLSDEVVFSWENNPTVRMYYVAMGKWRNHPHHNGLTEQGKSDILSLKIYDKADLHFVDSDYLKSILDNNENNFTAFIETIGLMELTPVKGVENSCIALCQADEFAKILTTEDGIIRKSLFDDNVRDYQGENTVNNEILETITEDPSKFILLNNGITVVCDDFTSNNRKLKIVNPQIVNGCQTSHIIFHAYQRGLDIRSVPLNVKIISTLDQEITNEIVRGTNRQNIVMDEAFEATKTFHKNLEDFFNHFNSEFPEKIFYERRAKQYTHIPSIKQTHKINLRILTQFFIGMYLDKPHLSHRHESYLIKEFSNYLFVEHQSKLPYFTAAYSFFQLEKIFREQISFNKFKPYKAHLLMIFRQIISGNAPSLNLEKQIDDHSNKIIDILKDEQRCLDTFTKSATILRHSMNYWTTEMKRSRFSMKDIEDFTNLLLQQATKELTGSNIINRENNNIFKGVVIKTLTDRFGNPCGFIKRNPNNLFFHHGENKDLSFKQLEGKFVTYKIDTTPNNLQIAVEVSVCD